MIGSSNKVPRHIGIILDGNRRFAKRLMLKPWKGHEWGAKKVEELFNWCLEYNIKELTLFCFSIENFNRPKEEFDYLINIFKKEFSNLLNDERIYKNQIKVNFIGRLWMLPEDLKKILNDLMEKTKNHKNYQVNFAIAYGGKQEIIDAVKKIKENQNIKEINEEVFSKNLNLNSDIDLIIRTGGEKRISNFLIWQGSYAELIFIDKLWPEFSKEDFVECLNEYDKRERRFGK